jgi:hypothetical protein
VDEEEEGLDSPLLPQKGREEVFCQAKNLDMCVLKGQSHEILTKHSHEHFCNFHLNFCDFSIFFLA